MEYTKEKRVEIENEYLALLINYNELINVTQIRPEWLANPKARKMLQYALECYNDKLCFNVGYVAGKHPDFDFEYYIEILDGVISYDSNVDKHLKTFEELIVKAYKEDIIRAYNNKLVNKTISYDEFVEVVKRLDDIILTSASQRLTKQELLDGINDEKMAIPIYSFPKLNRVLKLVQNDFLIIGATTGAGKSGFLLNLMNDFMYRYQCIYFNMEMSKSTIYKRIISIKIGIPMSEVSKPKNENQKGIIDNALNNIEKAGLIIEHKANNIKQIKAIISRIKDKKRHTVLFIDHLGLVRNDDSKSLYEQATEVAKQLRQICLEYDCTIISASQLNRAAYSNDVSLSMLKDSGELENSASKVALLYRVNKGIDEDETNTQMDLEIAKNRDGLTGIIRLSYDKTKQIFKEVERT